MPRGRSDGGWPLMMEAGRNSMVHTARRQAWILYPDSNREISEDTGTTPFDLSQDAGRSSLETLLADVVEADLLHSRFMVSSVVKISEADGPGEGFYSLAERLGHLGPGASREQKSAFWATHDHYRRRI